MRRQTLQQVMLILMLLPPLQPHLMREEANTGFKAPPPILLQLTASRIGGMSMTSMPTSPRRPLASTLNKYSVIPPAQQHASLAKSVQRKRVSLVESAIHSGPIRQLGPLTPVTSTRFNTYAFTPRNDSTPQILTTTQTTYVFSAIVQQIQQVTD